MTQTATCSECARAIEGAQLLYSPQGNPICPSCNANHELAELDVRAAKNITNAAVSSLLLALVSFVFNPFFLLTILSFSTGGYAIKSLSPSNERFAKHVASYRGLLYAAAIAGIVLSGLRVLLVVLGLGLLAVVR